MDYLRHVSRGDETSRQALWRDELLKTGVRGKGGAMLHFAEFETLPGLSKLVRDYARKADLTAEWSDAFSSRLIHGSRRRFGRAVETIINAIEQALAEGDRTLTGTHFAEAWGMQEGCAWDENVFVRKDWASMPLDGAADEFDAARSARQRKQLDRS